METPQQQQQQESVDNNTMQTDNTQQDGGFMEEENNEPLSLNQKREKLSRWHEHIAADPRSYSKIALETRETYLNLEKEIARDTAERNRHTARLCDEKKLSAANRDIVFNLLGANDPQGAALQSFMVDYVGANIMDREEADKRYAALELENTNLKKEREQESFNINAKRLRSQASPSVASTPTFNHQPAKQQQQTTSWSGASTNGNNNSTPAKSFGDQFSFLDKREGQVRKQERVDHEGLNSFMNPKMNGYQMPNEYKAPSVGVYALFQQFGGQCDQIQSKRASSATPISTTSS